MRASRVRRGLGIGLAFLSLAGVANAQATAPSAAGPSAPARRPSSARPGTTPPSTPATLPAPSTPGPSAPLPIGPAATSPGSSPFAGGAEAAPLSNPAAGGPSSGAFGPTAAAGAGALAGAGAGLADLSAFSRSGIPQMIGDAPGLVVHAAAPTIPNPFPPRTPLPPPSPRAVSALVASVRGLKIAENQSPRPQDRVFFSFNYFSNVNGALNQRFAAPVSDIRVYRYILGFEKTFDNGNGSIGVRMPIDTVTSNPRFPARFRQDGGTTTSLNNLSIFAKYILKQDPKTGSLISAGFAVSPTTGGGTFAGARYLQYINTTQFQPFLGYIWNRGNFYLQGFSAFEFPVNQNQVTEMFNDVGVGYFVLRSDDPHRFLTAVAPTFEVHVNSPLNHRAFDNPNETAGTADVVNLTTGVNFEFSHNSVLTLGFVTPVTGPRPFSYEALVLFNFRFGRTARRAPPPVISG